jgi:hypothetical protein
MQILGLKVPRQRTKPVSAVAQGQKHGRQFERSLDNPAGFRHR